MAVDGRRKGAAFENAVCRALSKWYAPVRVTEDTPVSDLPFRRRFTTSIPLSGDWRGAGDVLHEKHIPFPYCVECKNYAGCTLDTIFNPETPILAWWVQAEAQAAKIELSPLLVFHLPRRGPVYVFPTEVFQWLCPRPITRTLRLRAASCDLMFVPTVAEIPPLTRHSFPKRLQAS